MYLLTDSAASSGWVTVAFGLTWVAPTAVIYGHEAGNEGLNAVTIVSV